MTTRLRLVAVAVAMAGALLAPVQAAAGVPAGTLDARSNVPGLSTAQYNHSFVRRSGPDLSVAGRPLRLSGGNVEWLGLVGYGTTASNGVPAVQRYPSQHEIDDAFATMHEMGATVVRAQTLGDTIGCPLCLEPQPGVFNQAAFAEMDLVVAEARRYGLKLLGEFAGDDRSAQPAGFQGLGATSTDWYCAWAKLTSCTAFYTDPAIIEQYERHLRVVLDHVNPRTGLAYRDDPTFAGWIDGNELNLVGSVVSAPVFASWLDRVSAYFKTVDHQQLFVDISQTGASPFYGVPDPATLQVPGVDVYGQEWYPHWVPSFDPASGAATLLHQVAKEVTGYGKVYATLEYGWDRTNATTQAVLADLLNGIAADTNVSGDLFWSLMAHADGHGWQPIPNDNHCVPTCDTGEDGNWWAVYYTGLDTASHTAADMAARAQELRAHAYRMDGFRHVPRHELPPAPVITATAHGLILFEGAAGAARYSVQKRTSAGGWSTPCKGCTTDADGGWQDPSPVAGCYRVIGYNLDGVAGRPSALACVARRT